MTSTLREFIRRPLVVVDDPMTSGSARRGLPQSK